MEGSPNGLAVVLKTTGIKPLEVRLLCPPHEKRSDFFKIYIVI